MIFNDYFIRAEMNNCGPLCANFSCPLCPLYPPRPAAPASRVLRALRGLFRCGRPDTQYVPRDDGRENASGPREPH